MTEYAGYRVLIKRKISVTYDTIAQVVDLSGPQLISEQIEVSHRANGDPAEMWRRFVAGMKDGGEVTFQVYFDPDEPSHDPTLTTSMYALGVSGEAGDFQIAFPGQAGATTTATFDAFVNNFDIDSPLEEGVTADLTLKVSGPVTWAHVP